MPPQFDGQARGAEERHTDYGTSRPSRRSVGIRAVVVCEQNAHGAMTLRCDRTDATYQVVGYASPELRSVAGRLERGATVETELVRVGCRGNGWWLRALTVPVG